MHRHGDGSRLAEGFRMSVVTARSVGGLGTGSEDRVIPDFKFDKKGLPDLEKQVSLSGVAATWRSQVPYHPNSTTT